MIFSLLQKTYEEAFTKLKAGLVQKKSINPFSMNFHQDLRSLFLFSGLL